MRRILIEQRSRKFERVELPRITEDMLIKEEKENESESEYQAIITFFEEAGNDAVPKMDKLKASIGKSDGSGKIIGDAYKTYIVTPAEINGIKISKVTKKEDRLNALIEKYEDAKNRMSADYDVNSKDDDDESLEDVGDFGFEDYEEF